MPDRSPVGVGLIGAGGSFGTFIQSALTDVAGAELRAIADIDPRALAAARAHLGIDRSYLDANDLIADAAVDVVIVASPPFTQFALARRVLEAGKALFLEKPGSIELGHLRTLVDVQRAADIPATVDYVMRWNALLDVVREIVRAGWLGSLRSVQFVNYAQDETLPPRHWFWDRSKSGGIFVEHSVHFFDLYGDLAGAPPARIVANHTVRDDQAPGGRIDQVEAVVAHDNGVMCSYFHAFNRPKAMERQQAILACDHGFLTVHGWIADRVEVDAWVGAAQADALVSRDHVVASEVSAADGDLHGRDAAWHVDRRVHVALGLPYDRQESYRREVARGLADLLARFRDRGHPQRVTLVDALRSLSVACAAAGTTSLDDARDVFARYQPDGR